MNEPAKIINKMLQKDAFSQWLGIEVLNIEKGHCKLRMKIRQDMLCSLVPVWIEYL